MKTAGRKGIVVTTDNTARDTNSGPLSVLLRPPFVFLYAILLGTALKWRWSLPFRPLTLGWLGPLVTSCAALLFLFAVQAFRASGTPVRGTEPTTMIVRNGPYRFSRNPIYLSFILLVLGLSLWLNNLWLLITLGPAVGFIAAVVIPKEERFLERKFHDQYLKYRAEVRRWF